MNTICVGFNNANLATDPMTAFWSPARHGEFAKQVGADGYEAHPIGRFRQAEAVRKAVESGDLALSSTHQSFLELGKSAGVNGGRRAETLGGKTRQTVQSLAILALMPEMTRSVAWMEALQQTTDTLCRQCSILITPRKMISLLPTAKC